MAIPNLLDKYGITPAKPTSSGLPNLLATKYSPAGQAAAATSSNAVAARKASDDANSLPGIVKNTILGLPAAVAGEVTDQWKSGQQQVDQPFIDKGANGSPGLGGAAMGALNVGSGLATKLTAPLAPVFKPIEQATNFIGDKISNIPAVQKFSNSPSGQVTAMLADIVAKGANVAGITIGGLEALRGKAPVGDVLPPKIPVKLPVASESVETNIPVHTPLVEKPLPPAFKPVTLPEASHAEYAKSQGYEPYTPPEKLPVIEAGKTSKLPVQAAKVSKVKNTLPSVEATNIRQPLSFDELPAEDKAQVVHDTRVLFGKGHDFETARQTALARFNGTRSLPKGESTFEPVKETTPSTIPLATHAAELTKKNGGVTIGLNGDVPTKGFAFSPRKDTEVVVPKKDFNDTHVSDYINTHFDKLAHPDSHLGIWEDNGKIYMDISHVVQDESQAVNRASKADQLAIFDLSKFDTKYTKDYEQKADSTYTYKGQNQGTTVEGSQVTPGQQEGPTVTGRSDRSNPVPSPAEGLEARAGNDEIKSGASEYNKGVNLPTPETGVKAKIDIPRARSIADAYDALPVDDSANPAVKAAYSALEKEIEAQWDHITQKMGIKLEPWKKEGQPYANSAEMMKDVRDNKHLYFFQGGEPHPLLGKIDPETGLSSNDKFRAVHDVFGHAAEGYSFGAAGEESAWLKHSQMLSPEAQKALTTETRGQNSWVNFGKHNYDGETYKNIPPADRPYAAQKVALLPDEFTDFKKTLGEAKGETPAVEVPPVKAPTLPKGRSTGLKAIKGTGDTKVRGLSQGIEAKAMENGLARSFSDLQTYDVAENAPQISKAMEFVAKDYEAAKEVALGQKAPPKGLLPESVLVVFEKEALARGDVATLRELATNSRLSSDATTMGQRIQMLAQRDPDSPLGYIKDLQEARAKMLENQGENLKAETQKLTTDFEEKVVRKSAPTKQTLSDFLTTIQC